MKVALQTLALSDTSRSVTFRPGLNIVLGPISTGKTSLLRLIRIVLGGAVASLPPEVRRVRGVAAKLTLLDSELDVYRPLSSSRTAKVDIAGANIAERLPASQASGGKPSYATFLLERLGLPRIEVPSAPTRPESDPTPVSISDYLSYCELPKEEIRSDVFGHRHPFKDIKRRYVFEILFGQYDVETARIQDDLRATRHRLHSLEQDERAFDRLLDGTRWENRAELEKELAAASSRRTDLGRRATALSERNVEDGATQTLRRNVKRLDGTLADLGEAVRRERTDVERFETLAVQLETQTNRLTRAIVANRQLLDIDFVVCPRCGSAVDRARETAGCCYLCLQAPAKSYSRHELVAEQDRVAAQLEETKHLLITRQRRIGELELQLTTVREERDECGRELDHVLASFVSDSAAEIQSLANKRGELTERIRRLRDYLKLYDKRQPLQAMLAELRTGEQGLLAELEEAKARRQDVEQRIQDLEEVFTELLRSLSLPGFLGEPVGEINRRTYMPSVSGRDFETLQSEGLAVEVNIAHALAHQLTAIKHGLRLPSILLIDGISGAFGDKGYDPARVASIYAQLFAACTRAEGELQIVVADTRIPEAARQHVILELTEEDRLVPQDYLDGNYSDPAQTPAEEHEPPATPR